MGLRGFLLVLKFRRFFWFRLEIVIHRVDSIGFNGAFNRAPRSLNFRDRAAAIVDYKLTIWNIHLFFFNILLRRWMKNENFGMSSWLLN